MTAFLTQVQTCALHRWSPGIGDPTLMGWVTVGVYLLAALTAFSVAIRVGFPAPSRRREQLFWWLVGIALLAFAINKQLDLQSYMTAVGRCVSNLQGWYKERRVVQALVVLGLILGMIVAAIGLWRMMHGTLARSGLALAGFVLVLGFVAVRAVGFHHVDALINFRVGHLRLNWLFELTGPTLIILGGLRLLLSSRPLPARHA